MPKPLLVALTVAALVVSEPAAVDADDSTVEHLEATTAAEQRAVEEFWTPERMREAERQTAARAAAASSRSGATPWPGRTSRAIGKIFYSLRSRDDVLGECSGAVVGGANGSVVATAAHCLYLDEDGGAHENIYFVPGYAHGFSTFERVGWTVRAFSIRAEWQRGRHVDDLQYDFGFLTMNPKDGRRIAEVTGAHGLVFEAPLPRNVLSVGYPARFPYDGESLHYCSGAPRRAAHARITSGPGTEDNLVLSRCGLTEGTSGGPWIVDYDRTLDLGTVVAVTSVGSHNTVVGRPFTEAARPLFDAAQAA